jgi:hypothetical protein
MAGFVDVVTYRKNLEFLQGDINKLEEQKKDISKYLKNVEIAIAKKQALQVKGENSGDCEYGKVPFDQYNVIQDKNKVTEIKILTSRKGVFGGADAKPRITKIHF